MRTVRVDRLEERLRRIREQQVRLVEEEDELRLVEVADLGQLLEELREQPHQRGREQRRPVLHRRELERADHTAAVGRCAQEVGDLEERLAEELVAAAVLELDERAQQDADRLAGDAADARQVGLARVRVEVREERTQVCEVDQDQPASSANRKTSDSVCCWVSFAPRTLPSSSGPEVGHGRPDRDAGADAAEREELDGYDVGSYGQAELAHPLRRRPVGSPGCASPERSPL